MDVCLEPDCGEEFPGDVTHGRCPRCGAKLHPTRMERSSDDELHIAKEARVLDTDPPGFMRNILGD